MQWAELARWVVKWVPNRREDEDCCSCTCRWRSGTSTFSNSVLLDQPSPLVGTCCEAWLYSVVRGNAATAAYSELQQSWSCWWLEFSTKSSLWHMFPEYTLYMISRAKLLVCLFCFNMLKLSAVVLKCKFLPGQLSFGVLLVFLLSEVQWVLTLPCSQIDLFDILCSTVYRQEQKSSSRALL